MFMHGNSCITVSQQKSLGTRPCLIPFPHFRINRLQASDNSCDFNTADRYNKEPSNYHDILNNTVNTSRCDCFSLC